MKRIKNEWLHLLFTILCASIVVLTVLLLSACKPENYDSPITSASDIQASASHVDEQEFSEEEKKALQSFYDSLRGSLYENDVNVFNSLLVNEKMNIIKIISDPLCCYSAYTYPNGSLDATYISNGKLFETILDVDPPESFTGLTAVMFGENSSLSCFSENCVEARLTDTKWETVDLDYVDQHIEEITGNLKELHGGYSNSVGEDGKPCWVGYKLNNEYLLISNCIYYDIDESNSIFYGTIFVLKKTDKSVNIAAIIDIK